ncbi:hypothetical protein MTO96_016836 [Rhipicephalus appendiculatus]
MLEEEEEVLVVATAVLVDMVEEEEAAEVLAVATVVLADMPEEVEEEKEEADMPELADTPGKEEAKVLEVDMVVKTSEEEEVAATEDLLCYPTNMEDLEVVMFRVLVRTEKVLHLGGSGGGGGSKGQGSSGRKGRGNSEKNGGKGDKNQNEPKDDVSGDVTGLTEEQLKLRQAQIIRLARFTALQATARMSQELGKGVVFLPAVTAGSAGQGAVGLSGAGGIITGPALSGVGDLGAGASYGAAGLGLGAEGAAGGVGHDGGATGVVATVPVPVSVEKGEFAREETLQDPYHYYKFMDSMPTSKQVNYPVLKLDHSYGPDISVGHPVNHLGNGFVYGNPQNNVRGYGVGVGVRIPVLGLGVEYSKRIKRLHH